jgi:hypothetical protein
MPRTTRPRTLAAQGAEERRKRDSQIMSAQGGGSRAKPKAKNTRTPQTARQRSTVAKRKIASQVSSASQGITKSKRPALDQNMQTLKSAGETLIKIAMKGSPAHIATELVKLGKAKPEPKAKESGSYEARRDRASVKPAAAKPKASTLLNPPKKRKAPKYRG